jgi:hypothetical protein
MLGGQAFVSTLVVAGEPCHELLRFRGSRALEVVEQGLRRVAPDGRRHATVAKDLDDPALLGADMEAQILVVVVGHGVTEVRIREAAR